MKVSHLLLSALFASLASGNTTAYAQNSFAKSFASSCPSAMKSAPGLRDIPSTSQAQVCACTVQKLELATRKDTPRTELESILERELEACSEQPLKLYWRAQCTADMAPDLKQKKQFTDAQNERFCSCLSDETWRLMKSMSGPLPPTNEALERGKNIAGVCFAQAKK